MPQSKVFFCWLVVCIANSTLAKPRISIITSVFKGNQFIEGFMRDITRQTIFNDCELIMINANSPDNEEQIIARYVANYPNIIYKRLDYDPGLYAVWNMAIKMAQGDYITNANLDDRRNPSILEIHAGALDNNPEVELVYSPAFVTHTPNATYESGDFAYTMVPPEFDQRIMYLCIPGPMPMWKKSIHTKYGYFDETFYSAGDHEMWLRAVSKGSIFKKVDFIAGSYYENPSGLSTDTDSKKSEKRNLENCRIVANYSYLWNE